MKLLGTFGRYTVSVESEQVTCYPKKKVKNKKTGETEEKSLKIIRHRLHIHGMGSDAFTAHDWVPGQIRVKDIRSEGGRDDKKSKTLEEFRKEAERMLGKDGTAVLLSEIHNAIPIKRS
jgi:hypothetical protein